jgi:hypothetical protein
MVRPADLAGEAEEEWLAARVVTGRIKADGRRLNFKEGMPITWDDLAKADGAPGLRKSVDQSNTAAADANNGTLWARGVKIQGRNRLGG